MSDTIIKLQPIFRDIFENSNLVISRESSANSVEGWDSLTHIHLVMAIEQEFQIKFALGELQALKNVGDMSDLIERKLSH